MCLKLLESTTNQFVLFQVGCCLKNGVLREWSTLSLEQARALYTHLFDYVNRQPVEQFVIEELMLVGSLIFKRITLSDSERQMDKEMTASLFDIIKNPNSQIKMRLNACTAILQILNEFLIPQQGSTSFRHSADKRFFERLRLKEYFQNTIEVLFYHLKANPEVRGTEDWLKLCSKLVSICEKILCWTYVSELDKRFIQNNVVFKATNNWLESNLNSNIVSFFFEVYITIRTPEQSPLVHQILSCLDQISFMSFPPEYFMENFVKLSSMFDILLLNESVMIANLINSMCNNFRLSYRIDLQNKFNYQLYRSFLNTLAKFTIRFLYISLHCDSSLDEDNFQNCNQAIDYLFNSWVILINLHEYTNERDNSENKIKKEEFASWTKSIFEIYVKIHLSQPEGFISEVSGGELVEFNDFEEDDNIMYREQLSAIGTMCQFDTLNVVSTLTNLFLMKINQFESCVLSNDCSEQNQKKWSQVCDDIHWILMISRNIFSTYGESEGYNIISISINSCANIQQTINALQNMDCSCDNIDPVVRFFIVLLKFTNSEKCLLERRMIHWISPQVSYSLTLFINAFMSIYLVSEEDNEYEESGMSLSLNSCFGIDSPTAKHLVNFFLDHLLAKFLSLSSEANILDISTEGLKRFSKSRERKKVLVESSSLAMLLERFSRNEFPTVNSNTRRNMYYVFMQVYADSLDKVIDPLIGRYQKFCAELSSYNKQVIQEQFMQLIECTQGIVNSNNAKTSDYLWNKYLLHFYNDLPRVLNILHDYSTVVQTILELLFNYSYSCSGFMSTADTIQFYNTSVNILSEYARHNTSIIHADQARIEEIQKEFNWILKFLMDLSSIHGINFLFNESDEANSLLETIGKVVLTSLNIIMPLMNEQILEDSKLCEQFYQLLEHISHDFKKFQGFPPKLSESYLRCVEYVFTANK